MWKVVVKCMYKTLQSISCLGFCSGEGIEEAACREVFEETGIRSEFQCVICFRHMHGFRFGCSDFYFVCLLKPLNTDIQICQHEIEEAKWMDVSQTITKFLVQNYVHLNLVEIVMTQSGPIRNSSAVFAMHNIPRMYEMY